MGIPREEATMRIAPRRWVGIVGAATLGVVSPLGLLHARGLERRVLAPIRMVGNPG